MSLEQIDSVIAQWLPVIEAVESDYIAARGRYVQGLWTHSLPPTAGQSSPPDRLTARPTDQAETWRDIITARNPGLPQAWRMALRIDVHDGPQGKGYTIYVSVQHAGQQHIKAVGRGPHSITHDWQPAEQGA